MLLKNAIKKNRFFDFLVPLSEKSCREWFQKFKNGEFDIEDKERRGRPKVYEDAELQALLDQDPCQAQKEQ